MSIEPIPSVKTAVQADTVQTDPVPKSDDTVKSVKNAQAHPTLDAEAKTAFDRATGLLQTIVTNKLSDKVIRKMPSDEYLHLLSLLDEITNGSIDKRV